LLFNTKDNTSAPKDSKNIDKYISSSISMSLDVVFDIGIDGMFENAGVVHDDVTGLTLIVDI
jgi:hypothetical protein